VAKAKKRPFSLRDFLNSIDGSGTEENYRKNQKVYAQGDPADEVFYVQEGKLKVCVVSSTGRKRWLRCMARATSSARLA
jgi:CRP/FNR family cyclic AMP-dependent transcriptional regulator